MSKLWAAAQIQQHNNVSAQPQKSYHLPVLASCKGLNTLPPAPARSSGAAFAAPCCLAQARGRTGTSCCAFSGLSCSSCHWCLWRGLSRRIVETPIPSQPETEAPGSDTRARTTARRAWSRAAPRSLEMSAVDSKGRALWGGTTAGGDVKSALSVAALKRPRPNSKIQQASPGRCRTLPSTLIRASLCNHKDTSRVQLVLWGAVWWGWIPYIVSSPLPLLWQDRPIFRRPVVWMLKIKLQVTQRDGRGQQYSVRVLCVRDSERARKERVDLKKSRSCVLSCFPTAHESFGAFSFLYFSLQLRINMCVKGWSS